MTLPPPPPKVHELPYGTVLHTPMGTSVVLADMDFETYSEAGFLWSEATHKWVSPLAPDSRGSARQKKGLSVCGLQIYATHPSTEVLCLSYDLKDGRGPRLWTPHHPLPVDLFAHLASGKLVEAFNSTFEERIWTHVCVPKYGFPPLPLDQIRCAAAKARAYCLPPSLADATTALSTEQAKDTGGKDLIRKLCIPRNPTKTKPARRNLPVGNLGEFGALCRYCVQDIRAEAELSSLTPDLIPSELAYWQADQDCNREGVRVDLAAVDAAIALLERKYREAAAEIEQLTAGAVSDITEVQRILAWLASLGVHADSLEEDALDALLNRELPDVCRRVLELRSEFGSAAVKKFPTIRNTQHEGRIHDQFLYHGARTGRDVGRGVQLQNLFNGGPEVRKCGGCPRFFSSKISHCPYCSTDAGFGEVQEWSPVVAEDAIAALLEGSIERAYPNPVPALSGSVRGVLIADEGCDFIGSDYSAIEAVVAACLSGEDWQIETFRRKEDIYLATASRITGIPIEEYKAYKEKNGQHHPHRKLGKVACLGSGYGGWIQAWINFGADKFMNEEEIRRNILAWRDANPNIVNAWGGQTNGKPWEGEKFYYGLEGAFLKAVMQPSIFVPWRNGVGFIYKAGNVYMRLPSGRYITYHNVVLYPHKKWEGQYSITFEGFNTNVKMGALGWTRLETYGGRLFENVCQAVARDILAHAAVNLHTKGYRLRLRVHDELVVRAPEGWGSVAEMEGIMNTLPAWAEGWPIRAAGGWRGKRFRK